MTTQVKLVARFKDSTPESPRFTQTGTIEELIRHVNERLPVDVVYVVEPHADGLGFSLREAGTLIVTISPTPQPVVQVPKPVELVTQAKQEVTQFMSEARPVKKTSPRGKEKPLKRKVSKQPKAPEETYEFTPIGATEKARPQTALKVGDITVIKADPKDAGKFSKFGQRN